MLDKFINTHLELSTSLKIPKFKRFLFDEIAWDEKLLAILGARGTGKTTILWQYYQQAYNDPQKCLYLPGDGGNLLQTSISDLAREFHLKKKGKL